MSDKIKQLLEGHELSEETMTKVSALVEAKVNEKVQDITEAHKAEVSELKESHEAAVAEIKESTEALYESKAEAYGEYIQEEYATKVDAFLNYAVREWAKDNALAIEGGVTADLFESFMGGFKSLIEAHDVAAPESKDVLESVEAELAETKAKLDEAIQKSIDLSSVVESHEAENVIFSVCEDLTDTQIEKVKALSEGIEFGSVEEYTSKIKTIVETYFSKDADKAVKTTVSLKEDVQNILTPAQMIAAKANSFF